MNPLWGALVGFGFAFVPAPLVLSGLRRLGGQPIRTDGPATHLVKAGTPTMGGVLFVAGLVAAVVLFFRQDPPAWTLAGVAVLSGLMGAMDDLRKLRRRQSLGLKARHKLALGLVMGVALAAVADGPLGLSTWIHVPFGIAGGRVDLGPWYFVVVPLVLVATTNAVNLADGMDGLAGGLSLIALTLFAAVAVGEGETDMAGCALAAAGACAGFLYYNVYPARVFMGDLGAFFLGGALAALAVLTRWELLLVLVGLVFVLEAVSDIVQVVYFRRRGRRLLRMAPLHHHFELGGMPPQTVVYLFWAGGLLAALVGIWSLGWVA